MRLCVWLGGREVARGRIVLVWDYRAVPGYRYYRSVGGRSLRSFAWRQIALSLSCARSVARRKASTWQCMPGFKTSRGLAQFRRGAPQRNNGRERRRSRGIAADMCHVGATAGGDRGGRGRRLRERPLPPFPIPQQPDFCATSASTPRRASRPTRHNPPTHPTYLLHPCPLLLERAGRAWKGGGASVRRLCEAGGRVAEAGRQRSGDRSGKSARRRHLHAQAPWLYPLTMASRSRSWAP